MAITRRQLRRDILKDLGDLRILTATDDGQDDRFIDTINLVGEVGAYTGRYVLFSGGTPANLREIRYITGSSASNRAIGFGTALPAATAVGDEAEMANMRGLGYMFQDVEDAINRQIRGISDLALVPSGTDTSVYADGAEIQIPPEFVTVEDVQWQDECNATRWHSIRPATRPGGYGWWVDRASRSISISGNHSCRIDGKNLRVWGLTPPAELLSDDDETTINPDWLIMACQAQLLRGRFLRAPTPETGQMMVGAANQEQLLRHKVIATRRSPFSQDL